MALLRNFAERKAIHYPMLSDPESKIIRAFGILNESVPQGNMAYGVPHPGTFIVDENGVVRAKFFEEDYRDRYTAGNILWREFGPGEGRGQSPVLATAETPHLKLSLLSSDAEARPGARLTLALEIELKPGMHVYAPGVEGGYIPIEWKLAESKGWKLHELSAPPSRKLNLPAIHETVPVYEGKFRMSRDLTVAQTQDLAPLLDPERKLAIEGSFRYQACDEKECFPPRTIPLRFVFKVDPLDRERAPAGLQRK